jgi:hypothetical protein
MSKHSTNFKVGDKLIDFKSLIEYANSTDTQMTFNCFLSNISPTVTSVSNKHFSIGYVDLSKNHDISSVNQDCIYSQVDGCSVTGNNHRLYKFEDFKDSAIEQINEIFDKRFKEISTTPNLVTQVLQDELATIKRQLLDLACFGTIDSKSVDDVQHYLDKRKALMLSKFE